MAAHLPEGAAEIQRIIANYLGAKVGALAMVGVHGWAVRCFSTWVCLHWLAGRRAHHWAGLGPWQQSASPCLARHSGRLWRRSSGLRPPTRLPHSPVSAVHSAHVGHGLPYTPVLITLTFVAGLVPIVGNLVQMW